MLRVRKTLDWEKRGGRYWGHTKKRFCCDSIFSCNRRLRESFSVCSLEIVSLRHGWTGPTDKTCFAKTLSVLPKHFCVLALIIQNNLYSHSRATLHFFVEFMICVRSLAQTLLFSEVWHSLLVAKGPTKIWYYAPNRQRVQEYKIPQDINNT